MSVIREMVAMLLLLPLSHCFNRTVLWQRYELSPCLQR